MSHDHVRPGPCLWCSLKHMGAAKVRIGEALASSDPERRRARLLDATFEMNEAETTHLSDRPELSQRVRKLRKKVEEAALENAPVAGVQDELNDIIDELTKGQIRQGQEAVTRREGESVPSILPGQVHEAILRYEKEYRAPASVSDIQFLLTIPHGSPLDKEIDEALEKAPADVVKRRADELLAQGVVKTTEFGGYVNPEGLEAFNIPRATKRVKMASMSSKDVGVVVGSSFVARVAEKGIEQLDNTVTPGAPPHARLSTYLGPVAGALAVLYGWHEARKGRADEKDLALVVAGSQLLTRTVDVAQQAVENPAGFVVRSYQPPAAAPRITSNRPLF